MRRYLAHVESGAVLAVRDVTVTFGGIVALEEVSLELRRGEVLGVIGPNGAGKTTLFNVICGFVRPDAGSILWHGNALDRVRPHDLARLGIARTLQGVGLFPQLTALENVIAGAERFRRAGPLSALLALPRSDRDERDLRERALAVLRRLDCEDAAPHLPGTLPFAIQKRVALARGLVAEPELLLLDEPAGGLGSRELDELAELIRSLRGSTSVMLVEHHMDLVMSVCDRVVVLDFGRVIAAGETDVVRRDERVLEAYLGREAAVTPAPGGTALAGAAGGS
jgi:branched-chain amino acid transport system ATP-binding protein